jgi:hypothetical protein
MRGCCSVPLITNFAYGKNNGWVKLSARRWISMLTTGILAMDDTSFTRSAAADRSSVGQRRAAAISFMRGSGLTTNGLPTAASSGVSYTLSL